MTSKERCTCKHPICFQLSLDCIFCFSHRLAQAALLKGLPRLKAFNIPTKRPDDFLAEMAKTDAHMTKVRENLLTKKLSLERSEKAKKLREMRKFGKQVQQEVLAKRQKEKKEMMEALKKYRKGRALKS